MFVCRYTNFEPIGDGSYGFVCSAVDNVSASVQWDIRFKSVHSKRESGRQIRFSRLVSTKSYYDTQAEISVARREARQH